MEPQQSNPPIPPTPPPPEQRSAFFSAPILIAGALFAVVLIVGIVWYMRTISSQASNTVPENSLAQKVVIGYTPWVGFIAFFVARDKGYFADEGLDVELKQYPSLRETSLDYEKGGLQGALNTTFDTVLETEAGLEHKIILLSDYSKGADGIIARPGIMSIKDVKGKKVGYEFGTLEDFFLQYTLHESGLSIKDIVPVNLDGEHAAKALVQKEVDVAVTYEPSMTPALYSIAGNKIYSSAQAPGLITDTLTLRTDFIEKNPNTVAAIVRAYFKAIDFIKFNPGESHRILAKAYGMSTDEVVGQLEGIEVADKEANLSAFSKNPGTQSLYSNLQGVVQFVQASKSQEKPIDSNTLIDPRFVNEYLTKEKATQ